MIPFNCFVVQMSVWPWTRLPVPPTEVVPGRQFAPVQVSIMQAQYLFQLIKYKTNHFIMFIWNRFWRLRGRAMVTENTCIGLL